MCVQQEPVYTPKYVIMPLKYVKKEVKLRWRNKWWVQDGVMKNYVYSLENKQEFDARNFETQRIGMLERVGIAINTLE